MPSERRQAQEGTCPVLAAAWGLTSAGSRVVVSRSREPEGD